MEEQDWLARRFEENRARLRAVAYRMLGSTGEAEDAVQEAWLRLARSDPAEIENLGGWLTTVAFVLHDVFGVPFGEVASVIGRSPNAAKMLASRARRQVRGGAATSETNPSRKREIVGAFLAASREGNFDALLTLLDQDVVLRADHTAVRAGAGGGPRHPGSGRRLLGACPGGAPGARRRGRRGRVGAGRTAARRLRLRGCAREDRRD
jgi:RNA polymerase sigma-70 factor (ECF subfamily)